MHFFKSRKLFLLVILVASCAPETENRRTQSSSTATPVREFERASLSVTSPAATTSDLAGAASGRPGFATLADYWHGKARWTLHRVYDPSNLAGYKVWWNGEGAHIYVTSDGTWYLFNRHDYGLNPSELAGWWRNPADAVSKCRQQGLGGTDVRKSVDHGATWSPPVPMIVPTEGQPWECMGTDGDAYFDEAAGTWHYLFQCHSSTGIWNGCAIEMKGPDPTVRDAPWRPAPGSPGGLVIRAGEVWNKICQNIGARCSGKNVSEEGTFQIFERRVEAGTPYFYVSFHGAGSGQIFRGIAKTPDFVTWIAGDATQNTPGDDIFDATVGDRWPNANWRGGSKGGGAGGIIYEAPYYYLITEDADLDMGCKSGQNWLVGLLRSSSLTDPNWDNFAKNPVFFNPVDDPTAVCNLAYNRIFKDTDGQIYLSQHRSSFRNVNDGIYLYRLVPTAGLLRNGDLETCSPEGWSTQPASVDVGPTEMRVERSMIRSPNANCHIQFTCGPRNTACNRRQSVYQDVDIGNLNLARKDVAFGGRFNADAGTPTLRVAAHEYTSDRHLIASHAVDMSLSQHFRPRREHFTVNPRTRYIRYELLPKTSGLLYRAGDLFVEPYLEADLPNGSFNSCKLRPWSVTSSVSAGVKKDPAKAYPGNQCLSLFRCKDSDFCAKGAGLYQLIDAKRFAMNGKAVYFGGKFRLESGKGIVRVIVTELDDNHRPIKNHEAAAAIDGKYKSVDGYFFVGKETTWLRVVISPETPSRTYRASELYLRGM